LKKTLSVFIRIHLFTFLLIVGCGKKQVAEFNLKSVHESDETEQVYQAPDTSSIPTDAQGNMIRYGRELIVKTAYYLGPNGIKGKFLGNQMNCSSCHLDAGTRPYGLNYFSTFARYPQYRAREDRTLTLEERVNNCIERPHMGTPLPLDSKEMLAITSYIKWVGNGVPKDGHVKGDRGMDIQFPSEAADTNRGKWVYEKHCQSCHGKNGEGKLRADGISYEYPPVWGLQSYPPGSSMHRIIKAAQFIKANMPWGISYKNPTLTDQEAFDVAAFINSDQHIRPAKRGIDYPNATTKPIDVPYGPYDDPFSTFQHRYGPYQPIIDYRKKENKKISY
jgi:thiosulfate dehydrogenase